MKRLLKWAAIALVGATAGALLFVQVEQHLARARAERLLADFHSIELRKSNWQDAQRLMTRWGAYGRYEGSCTPAMCGYMIRFEDDLSRWNWSLGDYLQYRWGSQYTWQRLMRVEGWLRYRPSRMMMAFFVQDGIIHRDEVSLAVDIPDGEFDYQNIVIAKSVASLSEDALAHHAMGDDDQLALHPEYKAGHPSCKINCTWVETSFTPYTPADQVHRLTDYQLDCITKLHPCRRPGDLLPIEREWRIYPAYDGAAEDPTGVHDTMKPCTIPVYALARDADSVVVVDAISSELVREDKSKSPPNGETFERTHVNLVETLKNGPLNVPVPVTSVRPFSGSQARSFHSLSEPLLPGKRYVLFLHEWPLNDWPKAEPYLERCGRVEDSPEVRAAIQKGLAQLDPIHPQEDFAQMFW